MNKDRNLIVFQNSFILDVAFYTINYKNNFNITVKFIYKLF